MDLAALLSEVSKTTRAMRRELGEELGDDVDQCKEAGDGLVMGVRNGGRRDGDELDHEHWVTFFFKIL